MFVHQDGVILCPTLCALDDLGVLEPSLDRDRSLAELFPDVDATGFAYLRVGLRCLASQGWLEAAPTLDPETTVIRWTDAGRAVASHRDRYLAAGRFLTGFAGKDADAWSRPWDGSQVEAFLDLVDLACDRWRVDENLPARLRSLITTHLDAAVLVPAMLQLLGAGLVAEDGPRLPDGPAGRGLERLLSAVGWLETDGTWTIAGREGSALAVHFGMAASYLPLLARLPDLYRGQAVVSSAGGAREWHVNRELNVTASAAAHTRYFADADRIFLELFNREPIESQPRFVADMGCGDGSWLVHLHGLIAEHTRRGKRSRVDPVLMVGIDYSPAALERARSVVDAADVPALLVHGDISDPDSVASALAKHGLNMEDGLHIRAFIDHDRSYVGEDPGIPVRGWSSGAYVDPRGQPLGPADVERDLVAHLKRWTPHVRKHGMVVLEAHCIDPRIVRKHVGATHSVAFDAYHGYSHQYPIDHSAFVQCCRLAGLRPATDSERRYPATRPFVAVSLNRLLVPSSGSTLPGASASAIREDTWQPGPEIDLEDGRALHDLLYEGSDLRFPRSWCSAATGFVVAGALDVVESRLAAAREGDVIRVLDYGAGTGLAAIELLKACHERGIEERLHRQGATLEVHLVDLPSSWFAQGYELLRDCSWTRFHSVRAPGGGFRPLSEVTRGLTMDAVMANMVFHLIPPSALPRVAAELAAITRPGGRLTWSSPDLGPPGPYAVLFHDPNRALRKGWLSLLDDERSVSDLAAGNGFVAPIASASVREAVERARVGMDGAKMRAAQARADRRVLPQPNDAGEVGDAVARHFAGEARVELQAHELLGDDIVDTLLVPSNQAEYLSEIEDRPLREAAIRELMLGSVIPELRDRAAGTAHGLNVQWTLGSAVRG